MTEEEAYVEGFCKTAEAYGVDPEALYKKAGLSQVLAATKRILQRPTALADTVRGPKTIRVMDNIRDYGILSALAGGAAGLTSGLFDNDRKTNAAIGAGTGALLGSTTGLSRVLGSASRSRNAKARILAKVTALLAGGGIGGVGGGAIGSILGKKD